MNCIFCKLKKPRKTWISIFASLKKPQKTWISFFASLKTSKNMNFSFCKMKKPKKKTWISFFTTSRGGPHRVGPARACGPPRLAIEIFICNYDSLLTFPWKVDFRKKFFSFRSLVRRNNFILQELKKISLGFWIIPICVVFCNTPCYIF